MFACVTTVQVLPDKLDDSLCFVREQVLPTVQGLAGYKSMYQLVGRTAGRVLGITLWETQEVLQNSASVTQRL